MIDLGPAWDDVVRMWEDTQRRVRDDEVRALCSPLHNMLAKHATGISENPRVGRAVVVWAGPNIHRSTWKRGIMVYYREWPDDHFDLCIQESRNFQAIGSQVAKALGVFSYDIRWIPPNDRKCLIMWDEPLWLS